LNCIDLQQSTCCVVQIELELLTRQYSLLVQSRASNCLMAGKTVCLCENCFPETASPCRVSGNRVLHPVLPSCRSPHVFLSIHMQLRFFRFLRFYHVSVAGKLSIADMPSRGHLSLRTVPSPPSLYISASTARQSRVRRKLRVIDECNTMQIIPADFSVVKQILESAQLFHFRNAR
jgi:hypothetical protein